MLVLTKAPTTKTFDLDGLCTAIRAGDAAGELAFYADGATVWVADLRTLPGETAVVAGRQSINHWVRARAAHTVRHHFRDVASEAGAVTFVDEWFDPSGVEPVRIWTWAAQVTGGQIVRCSVAGRERRG